MTNHVNPEMVNLARDLLGLSQIELSEITGIHPASLSRYEGGLVSVPQEELEILAEALDFPTSSFYREGHRHGVESGEVFHRKRSTVPAKQLKQLHATLDLYRLNVERLLKQVDVETPYTIPDYNLESYRGSVEDIADSVRASWEMPTGHVRNLTEALEGAFCMVFALDFGTDKIDEITQWVEPLPPIMLVNTRAPGDRMRFSMAHALGHLVMHHGIPPYVAMEKEADLFAAAFLMPARDIRSELKPVTLDHLLGLKPLWKVSVQALLNRALDLKLITETRRKSLYELLSRKGWRMKEPLPIPPERPALFSQLWSLYLDERRYTPHEMAKLLDVKEHRLREWYMPKKPNIRLIPKDGDMKSIG